MRNLKVIALLCCFAATLLLFAHGFGEGPAPLTGPPKIDSASTADIAAAESQRNSRLPPVRVAAEPQVASSQLRFLVQDGATKRALEGALIEVQDAITRLHDPNATLLDSTDQDGVVVCGVEELHDHGFVVVRHKGFAPRALPVSDLVPGATHTVALQPACTFKCRFVDLGGDAVKGVKLTLSKQVLLTSQALAAKASDLAGPDPDTALHCGVSDSDGFVVVHDLLPGLYYCNPQAEGMYRLRGLSAPVRLPMTKPLEVVLGDIYGAAIQVLGDEVLASNASWSSAAVGLAVRQIIERNEKAKLEKVHPGTLKIVAIPSLKFQRSGSKSIDFAIFGKRSGWSRFPIQFTPIRELVKQEITLHPGSTIQAGTIACDLRMPSGKQCPGAAVLARYLDGDRLQAAMPELRAGLDQLVPCGDYRIMRFSPFVDIANDGGRISIGSGATATVSGSSPFELAEVEPAVRLSGGDEALVFALRITEPASTRTYSSESFARGSKLLVPLGVPLEVAVWLPGRRVHETTITIDDAGLQAASGIMWLSAGDL